MRKTEFPRFCKVTKNDEQLLYAVSQVYKTGIYIALYGKNNSLLDQGSFTPKQAKKYMNQFNQNNLKPGLTSEKGSLVTIIEKDGMYEELQQ